MTRPHVHATCVALASGEQNWSAVLFTGPSGAGKSDLALRLLHDQGPGAARLIADDMVAFDICDGHAFAVAPETLKGRIEVRGIGIVDVPSMERAKLVLAFELTTADAVPRLPESQWFDIETGGAHACVPLFCLSPFEASAVAKVVAAHRAQTVRDI